MSKTYRRKKARDYDYKPWCYRRFFISRGIKDYWDLEVNDLDNQLQIEYKKYIKACYHRDTNSYYGWNGNAPASFRRHLNSLKKAKDAHEIKRINVQGDYEEYSFNLWKKDAGWLYW